MTDIVKLKVKEVNKQTADAVEIVFEKPSFDFTYQSGQFLTLIVDIDGKEVRRAYSLCSSPYTDENPAVAVKRVKDGLMSNYVNENLKPGDEISILPAMGNFKLEANPSASREIVLLGGGSGITPLISILKTVLTQEPNSKVNLIYANRDKNSVIFKEEIEKWANQYPDRLKYASHFDEDSVEQPVKKKGLFNSIFGKKVVNASGYLTIDQYIALFGSIQLNPSKDKEYYICGPSGMMHVADLTLQSVDIPASQIFRESFVADVEVGEKKESEVEGGSTVIAKLGGEEFEFQVTDDTILFTAMDKGIDIPYSCQSGLCTACMGKCVEGEVAMDVDMGLTDAQKAEGYVLTCVGRPKTKKVVIDFE